MPSPLPSILLVQLLMMIRFLRNPREQATWFSAMGVSVYVTGMLISAFALREMIYMTNSLATRRSAGSASCAWD
jgi:hypothetical protein